MIIIKILLFLFSILFCQNIKKSSLVLENEIYNREYQEQLNKKRVVDLERKIFGLPSYKIEREDNDYIFFLKNEKRLKLVGNNYNLIKAELGKMLIDYNKQIDTVDFWKIKFKEKVLWDEGLSKTKKAALDMALVRGEIKSEMEYEFAKSALTDRTYIYIEKEKNKVLKQNKLLKVLKPELKDFISFLGGYSELANRKYNLDDKSILEVKVMLEEIELTGPSKCLAKIKIIGNEDVLKFYNINNKIINYQGSYTINWDKNYINLFDGGKIWMDISFDKQKYLSKNHKIFLEQSLLQSSEKYSKAIRIMFDDLIPFSALADNIPKYRRLRLQYLNKYEKDIPINEIQNYSYEEWMQELFVLELEEEHQKEEHQKEEHQKEEHQKEISKKKEAQELQEKNKLSNRIINSYAYTYCFWSCISYLTFYVLINLANQNYY